jgi:hypothetical protein
MVLACLFWNFEVMHDIIALNRSPEFANLVDGEALEVEFELNEHK